MEEKRLKSYFITDQPVQTTAKMGRFRTAWGVGQPVENYLSGQGFTRAIEDADKKKKDECSRST